MTSKTSIANAKNVLRRQRRLACYQSRDKMKIVSDGPSAVLLHSDTNLMGFCCVNASVWMYIKEVESSGVERPTDELCA